MLNAAENNLVKLIELYKYCSDIAIGYNAFPIKDAISEMNQCSDIFAYVYTEVIPTRNDVYYLSINYIKDNDLKNLFFAYDCEFEGITSSDGKLSGLMLSNKLRYYMSQYSKILTQVYQKQNK